MVRTREFDPIETLDKAMQLFWHKGYAETSVRDLVEYTGVAHAGLYSAFGDKRSLYKSALLHYDRTYGDMLMAPLEQSDSGRKEVEQLFNTVLDAVKTCRFGDGCFMVNTAVEFGNDAEDILISSRRNIERMTAAIKNALRNAQAKHEVRTDLNPTAVATFLVSTFHGIAVLARSKSPYEAIEQSVRIALQQLE